MELHGKKQSSAQVDAIRQASRRLKNEIFETSNDWN